MWTTFGTASRARVMTPYWFAMPICELMFCFLCLFDVIGVVLCGLLSCAQDFVKYCDSKTWLLSYVCWWLNVNDSFHLFIHFVSTLYHFFYHFIRSKIVRACHPDKQSHLQPGSRGFLESARLFTILSDTYNRYKTANGLWSLTMLVLEVAQVGSLVGWGCGNWVIASIFVYCSFW